MSDEALNLLRTQLSIYERQTRRLDTLLNEDPNCKGDYDRPASLEELVDQIINLIKTIEELVK